MLKVNQVFTVISRNKHARHHWSNIEKKIFPKHRALQNFDDFYGSVFGNRWKSIRIALLCQNKHIALVNNFGDTEKTIERLERDGAINVRSIYNVAKKNQQPNNLGMFENMSVSQIDNRVDQFMDRTRDTEMTEILPNGSGVETVDNPKKLTKEEMILDAKKSLEKSIEEDSDLDYRRLINPAYGTSGLYEFVPASKIKGMEEWVFESDHYKTYSNTMDFPMKIEMEKNLEIPENLHMFTYEQGNVSDFQGPKKCTTGVLSHFIMDGASILPPIALSVEPGDRVLDACAAPGGKSLLMLQTLYPNVLVCNDVQESRVNRIHRVMKQFFYDFHEKWHNKRCFITQEDARSMVEFNMYDKILVDVPCTTDRHAVMEDDNNIFKPSRVKERLRIPEIQSKILGNCLRLLKPGGSLVYSTCSLSPVQNDGVVHMALSSAFKEHGITCTIKDLSLVMQPFSNIFKFEHPKGLKYGQMVIPYLPANYGPMYFSKITRDK